MAQLPIPQTDSNHLITDDLVTVIPRADVLAWSSTYTYAVLQPCSYLGGVYVNMQTGNLNHTPGTDSAWWMLVSTQRKITIPERWDMPWDVVVIDDNGNYTISPTIDTLIAAATPGSPVIRYVAAVNGSDSYDGTVPTYTSSNHGPWCTITAAYGGRSHIEIADILYLKPGVYTDYSNRHDHNCQFIGGYGFPGAAGSTQLPKIDTIIAPGFTGTSAIFKRNGAHWEYAATYTRLVWGVYDTSIPIGDSYFQYTKVLTAAACDATPYSYAMDESYVNGKLHVNTGSTFTDGTNYTWTHQAGDTYNSLCSGNAVHITSVGAVATGVQFSRKFSITDVLATAHSWCYMYATGWLYVNNGTGEPGSDTYFSDYCPSGGAMANALVFCYPLRNQPPFTGADTTLFPNTYAPTGSYSLWNVVQLSHVDSTWYICIKANNPDNPQQPGISPTYWEPYWQLVAGATYTYQANPHTVVQNAFLTITMVVQGGTTVLPPCASAALVEIAGAAGGWYVDPVTAVVYVNRGDSTAPDATTQLYYYGASPAVGLSSVGKTNTAANIMVIDENITFLGGMAMTTRNGIADPATPTVVGSAWLTYLAKNCRYIDCPSSDGVGAYGRIRAYFDSCISSGHFNSAFAYYGDVSNIHPDGNAAGHLYSCKAIEFHCAMRNSQRQGGLFNTKPWLPGQPNPVNLYDNICCGSTNNAYVCKVSVGCTASNIYGSLYYDFIASKSYYIGCKALGSVALVDDWNADYMVYGAKLANKNVYPECFYYNCQSNGKSKYGMVAIDPLMVEVTDDTCDVDHAIMRVYNAPGGNGTNPSLGTGVIASYVPGEE